jgi:hypothetical protein
MPDIPVKDHNSTMKIRTAVTLMKSCGARCGPLVHVCNVITKPKLGL